MDFTKIASVLVSALVLTACNNHSARADEKVQEPAPAAEITAPADPVAALPRNQVYKFPGALTQTETKTLDDNVAEKACKSAFSITELAAMQLTAGGVDLQLMINGGTKSVQVKWDSKKPQGKRCNIAVQLEGEFMGKSYKRTLTGVVTTVAKGNDGSISANSVIAN